jgi:uncharacterized protein (DUF433 family)
MATQAMDDATLIERYIQPSPNKPGKAQAVLRSTGVSVWALIGYWLATNGDIHQVARDYSIPLEEAQAAFAYYKRHKHLIDAKLALDLDD